MNTSSTPAAGVAGFDSRERRLPAPRSTWSGSRLFRLIPWLAMAVALAVMPRVRANVIVSAQFVAVGQAGTILTSADGATWATRTSGTSARLRAATVKGSLITVVGESGAILTSSDGVSWTARTSGLTETLRGVAASSARFVAVGGDSASAILYSDDGVTWSSRLSPVGAKLRAVTWGNNQFVAVGANGAVLTSPDGVTWTTQNASTSERLDGAFWTGSQFSVLSATGKVLSSTDGVTWSSAQGTPPWWIEGLAWSGTKFVTVGAGGKIATSADASTWAFQTSGSSNVIHGVAWTGTFVTPTGNPIAALAQLRALQVPGVMVAVGASGTVLTSPDATAWTTRSSGTSTRLRAVTAQNGLLVAVGETGTALVSLNDGISWAAGVTGVGETLRGVATSSTRFVAVGGQNTSLVRYSDDGATWSAATAPALGKLRAVTWGNGKFVAVGANGTVLTSADGATWAAQSASTTDRLDGAFWTGTQYSVLSSTGKIFTSADGVSWTSVQGNPPSWIEGLAWSGTKFVTVGAGGKIKTSADATAWTFQTSGTSNVLHGVTWSGAFAAQTIDPIAALANLRNITVSGVTASGKVYDRSTAAMLNTSEAALVGVASGDTVTLNSSLATGVFADKTVGTGKTVTTSGFTLGGANAADYSVVQPTPTASITAVALTITGAAASDKIYDGTTAAALAGTPVLSGVIPSDTVVLGTSSAVGAFPDRNAGSARAVTASGYALTGADAANYTLTQPTGLTASITAKALSVSGATATGKVYDGTVTAALSGTAALLTAETAGTGTTADGKPYDVDTIAVGGTGAGVFTSKTVGSGKAVTVTGYTITGANSANYTAVQPTGLTASITAKALTIAGLSGVVSRTYDGTTVAGLTGTAAFLSSEAAGAGTAVDGKPYSVDTISISGTATGAFADRNVGPAKAITVTGLSLSGADSGNYTAVQPTGVTGGVTAKALTVAGVTAADKIYNATITATLGGTAAFLSSEAAGAGTTVDGKPYSVDTIAIGGTAAGVFADKDVATGKALTVTGVTVTGTDAANYSVTQPTGLTAAVTKKTLTVSGVTAANKIYDGTTAATLSGTPTLQLAEAPGAGTTADGMPYTGDTFSAAGTLTGTFADRATGTGKTVAVAGVTLSGAQSGNYDVAALTATADITPKALTISGVAAVATRVYDGTTVAGLTGTAAIQTAEATSTGTNSDGAPYTVDTVTVSGTAAGAFADRNVGAAKAITITGITVSGAGSTNYTVTQPTGLTGAVTTKALTVAGLAAVPTRVYDASATAGLTGTAAFLTAEAAGTGATSDGTPYTVDTITISGTAAGTFAAKTVGTAKTITVTGVTVTGADNANYTVTQPTGLTASVTTAGLTVSGVTANNRIYDAGVVANLNLGTAALVGVLPGDTVAIGTGTAAATFTTKTIGTAKPVTITGITISGADSGNYALTQPATTANITAKTLIVTGVTASNKQYDALLTATPIYTGATLVGVSLGDTVTFVSSGGSATFATKVIATGKVVTFTGLTLGGADGANYILTQPTTTANITAKNLTVAGVTANSKTYDGNATASLNLGLATPVGVISGDTVTVNTAGGSGTFADASAGLNKFVQVAGLGLAGADSANYTVTQPTTTASISTAGVNIAITNLNFTYDGTPKAATVTVTPGAAASIVYSGGGGAPTNAGSYTVSVNVTDNNYSGSATGTLTIAKASQTVNFASISGASLTVGSKLSLSATASSGLPVTYAVTSGGAAISGSTVTITQAGAVTIRATQAGNGNYNSASADQGFTGVAATKTAQTIAFGALPNVSSNAGSVALSATASSGLPVSFTVVSGPASLAGTSLALKGDTGLVVVRASQAGNDAFSAAPDMTRAFAVTLAIPDIFFADLTDDPGITGSAELIQNTGPRLDAKTGDIAAAIFAGTNHGTVLIVAPGLGLNVSLDFTLATDRTYAVPFTSAGRSLTLTGSYDGATLTGHIPVLKVSFSTQVQTKSGSAVELAGVYQSGAVNNASGGTATIVSATGQILVVANTGSLSTGAAGTVGADGTFNLTSASGVAISGAVDAPNTTVTGTVTVGNQAPVSFAGLSGATAHTDRLINLSSRVTIAPAAGRTLITGFVIGGSESKRVLLRGVGPALTGFGVSGALVNPSLQLFDAAGKVLATNDDWSGAELSAAFTQVGAFALTAGSKDAAILTTLAPGAYTMQLTAGSESGVGLAEIYDASTNPGAEAQRLINISTRGTVDTGTGGLLIGGFVITGNTPKKVLIRGVGPSLGAFGVAGTLGDPRVAVYSGSAVLAQNDDWSTATPVDAQQIAASAAELAAAAQSVGAFAFTAGSKDAAVLVTLAPGAYTAQVSGATGQTGVALVEIYEVP